ncbi:MAG: hypothetical protein DRQ02_00980 [Candidatus Latescibacterota bacterium]|nr:MAG: hypothetical protein DRQ02_00980 [Candidatus Latescibacterota bacterium]RKY73265.1 MAG: hypothetical protein DRQ24_02775 [Candidatus Latescibacterota bacterium]
MVLLTIDRLFQRWGGAGFSVWNEQRNKTYALATTIATVGYRSRCMVSSANQDLPVWGEANFPHCCVLNSQVFFLR